MKHPGDRNEVYITHYMHKGGYSKCKYSCLLSLVIIGLQTFFFSILILTLAMRFCGEKEWKAKRENRCSWDMPLPSRTYPGSRQHQDFFKRKVGSNPERGGRVLSGVYCTFLSINLAYSFLFVLSLNYFLPRKNMVTRPAGQSCLREFSGMQ